MPTWGEIGSELLRLRNAESRATTPRDPLAPSPNDVVRRKYLTELADFTGRPVIVYASGWLEGRPIPDPALVSVNTQDMNGFMGAVKGLPKGNLDLMIHTPGGDGNAAEAIMKYLRSEGFDHIRAIVPLAAMSAGTMMALSCDEIVMGNHSQLGPIDPQFSLQTPDGPRQAPAQAILDQFELAKSEIAAAPAAMNAWLPILRSYLPGLLSQCTASQQLAEDMVSAEMQLHMFKDLSPTERTAKSAAIAKWFNSHSTHLSHGRAISISDAQSQGVKVVPLESDKNLQDKVLSAWHGVQHSLTEVAVNKLIENHLGAAWILQGQAFFPMNQVTARPAQLPPALTGPNRAQRRKGK